MARVGLAEVGSLPMQHRFLNMEVRKVERDGDPTDEPTTYEVAISSESEVERWYGIEVLDHSKGAVDMTRLKSGAAVLVDHGGDQVGVVEAARVDEDRVLRGTLRFSRNARGQEVERDVADGIRRNISVGYFVKQAKMTEERNGVEVWRITRWEPAEVSIVSVPADTTVGVGRDMQGGEQPVTIESDGGPVGEDKRMEKTDSAAAEPVTVTTAEQEKQRAKDIHEVCDANGMQDREAEFLASTLSVEQVSARVIAARATKGTAQPPAEALREAGLSEQDAKRYSVARAIMCAADGKLDGVERDVHNFIEKTYPDNAERRGGVLVPLSLTPDGKRTLTAGGVGKGAETVFEQVGDLIELLRNRTCIIQLGARTLTGLTSPVSFPKQSSAMTAYWVGEAVSDVTASDVGLALAILAPKTLQATTGYSRQLLAQSSFDVESMVRNDLAAVHAIALDYAGIHGLGAAGEPTGVYKATGVSYTAVGGAMSFAKVVAMEGQVATANAMAGSLGWLMNPTMSANLKQVMKATNTWSPLWDGTILDGILDGYRAMATPQVSKVMTGSERTGGSELGAVFGNWADMVVGSWGALELVVDPYTSKKKGVIEVASFQLADILIRHGESFSKATGATS